MLHEPAAKSSSRASDYLPQPVNSVSCHSEILHRNDQFCDLGKCNFLPDEENQNNAKAPPLVPPIL